MKKEIPRSASIANELKANNSIANELKANNSIAPVSKVSDLAMPSAKPPDMIARMIELLSDINLSTSDIDKKMVEEFPHLVAEGWKRGTTREKMRKYPILAKTAKEARAMLWREVGRSKIDGFRAISDALDAEKIAGDGSREPDHKMRTDASKIMLSLMGEDMSAGSKTNISVGEGNHKIMIITSDGRQMGDII